MNYGYVRVSTGKQTVENQKLEILKYAAQNNFTIDGWIEETVSGGKRFDKRKLGDLLGMVQSGDRIICTELSRLGRSVFMIFEILSLCMQRGCIVQTINDNYCLKDDIQSKVLAFAFGLAAEIERQLISERTKEGLARKKAEGATLGRPHGAKSKVVKLTGKEEAIRVLLDEGTSISQIARLLHCDRSTLSRFIRSRIYENAA